MSGMLHTKEHYDLMEQFEKSLGVRSERARKEDKSWWPRGNIYCHGETNELFLAFRKGYAYGKSLQSQVDELKGNGT